MEKQYGSSTVLDTEFDVIDELRQTVDDVEKTCRGDKGLLEKMDYIKFLVKELDDGLSGDYEGLRRRRFITKQSS